MDCFYLSITSIISFPYTNTLQNVNWSYYHTKLTLTVSTQLILRLNLLSRRRKLPLEYCEEAQLHHIAPWPPDAVSVEDRPCSSYSFFLTYLQRHNSPECWGHICWEQMKVVFPWRTWKWHVDLVGVTLLHVEWDSQQSQGTVLAASCTASGWALFFY